MKFDPEAYTITIRKEKIDGEYCYVGRVAEFPNISAIEDTHTDAYQIILDAINTLKSIADAKSLKLPPPNPVPIDEFSGRITLRLPKSIHAKISENAEIENVSVNQYINIAIATYLGETDGVSRFAGEAKSMLQYIVTAYSKISTTTTESVSKLYLRPKSIIDADSISNSADNLKLKGPFHPQGILRNA